MPSCCRSTLTSRASCYARLTQTHTVQLHLVITNAITNISTTIIPKPLSACCIYTKYIISCAISPTNSIMLSSVLYAYA